MNWETLGQFEDIVYEKREGVAKVTINRPEKRNAFRPKTVSEMYEAFLDAREDSSVGVVLLTGAGPHSDGKYAFCSGGDQSVRGQAGYVDEGGVPRLNAFGFAAFDPLDAQSGHCLGRRLRHWRRPRPARGSVT